MRSLPIYFLLVIFTIFSFRGKAQHLTIAKDFNVCLYGLVDQYNHWVIPAKYTHINNFDNFGYAIVLKDNLYGIINSSGKEVIPVIYDRLDPWILYEYSYSINPSNELVTDYSYRSGSYTYYYKATKNNLCGVLDSSGKEIIPIKYSYLENYVNGSSVFTSADKKTKGFLDMHGIRGTITAELLPKFTNAQKTQQGIYIISKWEFLDSKKKKSKVYYGAINDSARMILPMEFDSINSSSGFQNIIEAYKDGKTFFYKKDGSKLFNQGFYVPGERSQKVTQLILRGYTPANNSKKWGVLNLSGKIILDFIYDSIQVFNSSLPYDTLGPHWKILENNKWGLINSYGEWILKPAYENIYSIAWKTTDDKPEYVFMLKSNHKWGSVSSKGNEIMPFVYDTLFQFGNGYVFWSENSTELLVSKYSRPYVALYDYDPEIDKKKAEIEWKKKVKAGDSTLQDLNFTYQYPFENFRDEGYNRQPMLLLNSNYYYEQKHVSHYEFGNFLPSRFNVEIIQLSQTILADKNFYFYQPKSADKLKNILNEEGGYDYAMNYAIIPFVINKSSDGKMHFSDAQVFSSDSTFTYYEIFVSFPGTKYAREFSSPEIIRSDGKIILNAGILTSMTPISLYTKPTYLVQDRNENFGIMDLNGNFLIDTIWNYIEPVSTNLAWVNKSNSNGRYCDGEWNQYSINKKQLLFPLNQQFLDPVRTSFKNTVAATGTGVGVFNSMQKVFVINPIYREMLILNSDASKFAAVTCRGNIGIYDSYGTLLSDTIWNSIVRISESPNEEQYLLFNKNKWALYNTRTGITNGDSLLSYKVISVAEIQEQMKQNKYSNNTCIECPSLKGPALNNFKPWQQKLIFDSLYHSTTTIDFRTDKSSTQYDCPCNLTNSFKEVSINRSNWEINYQTDSTLMLVKSISYSDSHQYDWMPIYMEWRSTYNNIFLFSDGPRIMTLDSLFIGEAWKVVVENATMNFLRENPGINASCSNPSMYPQIFNQCFQITENGITFYPQWSYSDKNKSKERITFSIPWSAIKTYLRTDVKQKLNLN